jgi:plasmid rolling circle replication initiator protein Rep
MGTINSATTANFNSPGEQLEYLTDLSPKDRPWDLHRAQAQVVEGLYSGTLYDRLAERIHNCTGFLGFGWETDSNTGEANLKLLEAHFCRVRHCPVCQWRRSLMWQARFLKAFPVVQQQYPTSRWIFLTLTVRNCAITDLRNTIQGMNRAWNRFVQRQEFADNVQGWIRSTEVTRGQNRSAHPHFHCLLMVRPGYFGRPYVTQARWTELWREAARLDYTPIVDVRTVKDRRGSGEPIRGAIAETLKYSIKPDDLLDREWLLEITSQVFRLRFIATGGVLRGILRELEESDEDLMLLGEGGDSGDPELFFEWRRRIQRYVRL